MAYLGWLFLGLLLGVVGMALRAGWRHASRSGGFMGSHSGETIPNLLAKHFAPTPLEELTISERRFPFRVRTDLQRSIDDYFGGDIKVLLFTGMRKEYSHEPLTLSDCLIESQHNQVQCIPTEYEEVDIGEDATVRVLKSGLWLLEQEGVRLAVLLAPHEKYGQSKGMQFQVGTPNTPEGARIGEEFFDRIEKAVQVAGSYRGKILSLESDEHYAGVSHGITVHRLKRVERDQVILPETTLQQLDRNIIRFVKQREQLARLGQATKKGVLFYGPPGTGKTHTLHYLSRALPGHTTLLVSAEQVGLLAEYMTLARLLQPSIVVLEDVDLIAREREKLDNVCQEVMLNKLLNEMDGLKEEADILFLLTTNRPQTLEAALASRPGRVDQAIEFPLPDEEGRSKLIALYAGDLRLSDEIVAEVIRRTEGVSAAFIKELIRRTAQNAIAGDRTSGPISREDIDSALEEMFFNAGTLNGVILGAGERQEAG